MPSYFSINIECNRNKLYPALVSDFYNTLIDCGFEFKSGFMESEKDTLTDIVAWNQIKLNQNYEPVEGEDSAEDYKQICFEHSAFSEVRMFMINYKQEREFMFCIIIPEDDLITWKSIIPIFDEGRVEILTKAMGKVWELPFVDVIQTAVERCEFLPSMKEIMEGELPSAMPFAYIPKSLSNIRIERQYETQDVSDNGFLLRR